MRTTRTILEDPFYHTIILRTLGTGATIVAATLVLGYATAYVIAPLPPRRGCSCSLLLLVPLMVSNVIRAYGWIAILGRQGLVNTRPARNRHHRPAAARC